ncbi:MAG TPA: EAL domain-containing protein [Hyphomicrobiaceae bacterium]|nr:EAL domain-containing protein [Hyphomicrobiaceae bacterium]
MSPCSGGLEHIAHHDMLTGLFNRHGLAERLDRALAQCDAGDSFAFHVIDLDRFKDVNDMYGHMVGDGMLKEVGARLRHATRGEDVVARIGGDEFAVLQSGAATSAEASAMATRIVDIIRQPFETEGKVIEVGGRVGTALAPRHGTTREALLRAADLALWSAKSGGGRSTREYAPEMSEAVQHRRALEADLAKALAGGEFEVHYQPIYSLASRQVTGSEALIRWRHPLKGLISPAEFIPLAEETGLIAAIGRHVVRVACAEAATWPDQMKIAVNLSPVQIRADSVVEDICEALEAAALAPSRLELEITETALLRSDDRTRARLDALEEMGIGMSMDDFGTGYSSLGYLRRFAFDKIKIDRSFVAEIGRSADCRAIIQAITSLAASLGMTTTAEGIETAEQLAELTALGCTEGQGYLLARPMPASQLHAFLAEAARRPEAAASAA